MPKGVFRTIQQLTGLTVKNVTIMLDDPRFSRYKSSRLPQPNGDPTMKFLQLIFEFFDVIFQVLL